MRALVYMASRDKVDVDGFQRGIQYVPEKLGKSKFGFERTAVSNFKSKRHVRSGNEIGSKPENAAQEVMRIGKTELHQLLKIAKKLNNPKLTKVNNTGGNRGPGRLRTKNCNFGLKFRKLRLNVTVLTIVISGKSKLVGVCFLVIWGLYPAKHGKIQKMWLCVLTSH